MAAHPRTVPIIEFAEAMRAQGGSFAERITRLETRFGPVRADLLGVLAQAAFLCRVNIQGEANLLAACRAIRTGKPSRWHYHCQITPERWDEMHAYLVGIQCWLGIELPVPPKLNRPKLDQINLWLGSPIPARKALCELFLIRFVDDLLNYASFACLGAEQQMPQGDYMDYSDWYFAVDCGPYAVPKTRDSSRSPFTDPRLKERTQELVHTVRKEMASSTEEAEELMDYLMRQTQPPCMHRFSRYLDIQIASIGALKLRANLPPDSIPKDTWRDFWTQADAGLDGWIKGSQPASPIATRLQTALGQPSALKAAIVSDFLLPNFHDVGTSAAWDWLVHRSQVENTNAYGAFKVGNRFGEARSPEEGFSNQK